MAGRQARARDGGGGGATPLTHTHPTTNNTNETQTDLTITRDGRLVDKTSGREVVDMGSRADVAVAALRGQLDPPEWAEVRCVVSCRAFDDVDGAAVMLLCCALAHCSLARALSHSLRARSPPKTTTQQKQ